MIKVAGGHDHTRPRCRAL